MIFKQPSLGLTLAGLLLGALLSGCGDSSDTPKSMKKLDNVSKNNAAPLKKEKAFSSGQPLQTIREGRNFLNKEKLEGTFKEEKPMAASYEEERRMAASPGRVYRRKRNSGTERQPTPPYIAPHVEMPQ